MLKSFKFIVAVLFFVLFAGGNYCHAQACTGTVSSFPYNEGFETSQGSWIAGGTMSDWAWGAPSKSVITGAGGGNRCWVTGGLSGSSYNNGENSWLMSPCFDFSTLINPGIRFKLFWETEQRFDGAGFQYTMDGGNTWNLLGDINSNNNCKGTNWYNSNSVTYLGNINGWTGNIQPNSGSCLGGNGSGTWLTARHTLGMLAGQPNIRFRFLFGAGTTCNNFNGFAVDDILIEEATTQAVSIVSSCVNTNTVQFSVAGGNCLTGYTWNFGDPGSGSSNTAIEPVPSHTFSGPGPYTISVSTTSGAGGSSSATKEVVIINTTTNVNQPDLCSDAPTATLTVTPSGSNTGYFYNWDTNPPQTGSSITNVGPGIYNVTINAVNACALSSMFVLNKLSIQNSVVVTNSICTANNGTITSTTSGGTGSYTYMWSNGATGSNVQNLAPGNYSVSVSDAGGCFTSTDNVIVETEQISVSVDLGADISICSNEALVLKPGSFSTYLWQDGSVTPTYSARATGNYSVQVTDANGCQGADDINILFDCSDLYFPAAFSPDGNSINDGFGALGILVSFVQNYKLVVYNRYGQLMFTTNNPSQKWNGTYRGGIPLNGSYVWMASYKLNGKDRLRKGTIVLVR
ncbi:MAG: gliding motility-associated C-terminal domain-containing protein [Rhizobacter sp.]|nr:gliding motility-associated C-terminal domain-containing protein [Ferruginibacter sp.]